jgi:hypothetical protein
MRTFENEKFGDDVKSSIVNDNLSNAMKQYNDLKNVKENQADIGEWALTSEAQSISDRVSFIVYDFVTGRYENTLKDLNRGRVTKKQVYKILGKIKNFHALPVETIKYYTHRINDFEI